MSTHNTGPPNFLVPVWMVQPITDPASIRSGIKPRAIHRVMMLAREWTLNADISFSVAGIFPNTYTNSGEAHLGDEPFSAAPGDEAEIEIDWGAQQFGPGLITGNPMVGHYTFTDGAVDADRSLLGGFFGFQFQWIDMRPDRANTWETDELELMGQIHMSSPSDAYTLDGDGNSVPSDIGWSPRDYAKPIAWQSGEPGADFYGQVSISDSWTDSGYSFTFDALVTIRPTLYWSWAGKINTATGEVVPPPP